MRFIGWSVLLHLTLFTSFQSIDTPPEARKDLIEVETREAPPALETPQISLKDLGIGPSSRPIMKRGFLSNQKLYSSDVGELAVAENYIERVESLVAHPWRYRIGPRVKQLYRAKRKYKCLSCFHILLNSSGTPIDTKSMIVCPDVEIQAASAHVLNRNFPPVPETLLEEKHLLLEWCFEVK